MTIWVNQGSFAGMVLLDELVKLKGCEFGNRLGISKNDLKFSNGWVANFKKQNSLHQYTFIGEAMNVTKSDIAAASGFWQKKDSQSNSQFRRRTCGRTRERTCRSTHESTHGKTCESTHESTCGSTHERIRGRTHGRPRRRPRTERASNRSHNKQNNTSGKFKLTNIKLHYLPPNMTVYLQLLDAGIISEEEMKITNQKSEDDFLDDEVAEIIIDLSSSDNSEAANIAQTMKRYVQIVDKPVATEGILDDEEIITMFQAEENEQESDDDEEPSPPVIAKEVYSAIQTIL
ncbi:42504_t:CDS:2 [Gigaspora margarita]|uniref:42504_t:CDS:1 n=1 Tax=Gigaspora margarita TaxID=4874 RepID=A0ABN7UZ32_GIGMA|nr:42504_t:CDS:2 [Gigaspora margarita]